VILMFKSGAAGGNESSSVEQRVRLVWTRCHLGGARPWFRCRQNCGRRVAKLFLRDGAVLMCRHCCGLAYASQAENPWHRAISRAQKARIRLGGSANLLEPFPEKPRRMQRCVRPGRRSEWMRASRTYRSPQGLLGHDQPCRHDRTRRGADAQLTNYARGANQTEASLPAGPETG
jgi:hypothetical protein